MKSKSISIICLVIVAALLAACTAPTATPTSEQTIANPASQNCVDQGGTLTIAERGDGGQYGICFFEDNRQCEEWALLNGDCPAGGLKVTGYVTPAAQYCAITGGTYSITGENNTDNEQGTCTFQNGAVCDAWDYYNGKCSEETAVPAEKPVIGGGSGKIVFDSTRSNDYRNLYVLNPDSADVTPLTQGESNNFAGPWSPDGQQIVYTAFGLTNSNISLVNADGSGMKTLAAIDGSDEGFPDWSPDGKLIAFTSRRDGNNEIYLMNADGSNPVRLTNAPGDDFAASWSPDGKQIVFVSDRDQVAGIYDLYIMNVDGSDVRRLTNDIAIDYSPDWSPDGARIIYRSHHDGPADIYVINVDGSGMANLTDNPADDWAPTWSPDGTQIAFQSNRDGNWEIYRMAADGSDPVNLTNNSADDQLPYWQP